MRLGAIIPASYFIGLTLSLVGTYLKIAHNEGAETWFTIGKLASIMFIVTAIYEVRTSKRITPSEKTSWTLAFIFFNGIAGIIYIFVDRKRIVSDS